MNHKRYDAIAIDGLIEHNGVIYRAVQHLVFKSSCRDCDLKYHFEACGQINCMKHQRPDKNAIILKAVAFKEEE